jgi:hypothetical protein
MKKFFLTAFLFLFALSSFGLTAASNNQSQGCSSCSSSKKNNKKSITAKKPRKHSSEMSCACSSKCELGCQRSKTCNLFFTLVAQSPESPLVGQFQISIIAPNGDIVQTANIDASTISTSTDDPGSNNFELEVPAPVCAGRYTVLITNVNVDLNGTLGAVPFLQVNVTNSCNTNQINQPVPVNFQLFFNDFEPDILDPGTSTQIDVNIYPSFLPNFKKCKTECSCSH